jgi:hypothetical protein
LQSPDVALGVGAVVANRQRFLDVARLVCVLDPAGPTAQQGGDFAEGEVAGT